MKDTLDIADRLNKAGADLVLLEESMIDTTTSIGKVFFGFVATMNEFERNQISERTKSALAHLKSQNKRISGRIPYGYDLGPDGETLVENPKEQRAIQIMKQLRHMGVSYRKDRPRA